MKMSGGCSVRMSADVRRPRALEWGWQSKASERGKEAALAGVNNCRRDTHCDGAELLHQVVAECNAALGCSFSRAALLLRGPAADKRALYHGDRDVAHSLG